jgi:[ribosomal protein S5]-alanine N-acetyltransferase
LSFDSREVYRVRIFAPMRLPAAYPLVSTARLELRPFELADAADVQRLAGAREVADTTATIPHPYPDGVAEAWIATHHPAWEAQQQLVLAITERGTRQLMGAIGLVFSGEHDRAELGYWLGVPYWGKGFATDAATALVDFGFNVLQLNRIQAHHLARNPASGRVLTKAGLRREGMSPQAVFKNGQPEDVIFYGITRGAFQAREARSAESGVRRPETGERNAGDRSPENG